MKKLYLIICIVFLSISCVVENEPYNFVMVCFKYSTPLEYIHPDDGDKPTNIVRFFCSDPNLPSILQKNCYYVTFPGQYYLEYTLANRIHTTYYMIYDIILYSSNSQNHRPPDFDICLYSDGPALWYPYETPEQPEPENGTLPLSALQRYVGENHGPILGSSKRVVEGGHITMWYGKLNED